MKNDSPRLDLPHWLEGGPKNGAEPKDEVPVPVGRLADTAIDGGL